MTTPRKTAVNKGKGRTDGSRDATEVGVKRAIARAERLLPGIPAPQGKRDPRWQAIIRIGEFIDTEPEHVLEFAYRWGKHAQTDVRSAVATCLLEHLLEGHFELVFPRVRDAALTSRRFAKTLMSCWSLGEAESPKNAAKLRRLKSRLRSAAGERTTSR